MRPTATKPQAPALPALSPPTAAVSGDSRLHPSSAWFPGLDQPAAESSTFRRTLVVATLVHCGLLAVTWPTLSQAPPPEPEAVRVVQLAMTPRFKRPEPPQPKAPAPRTTRRLVAMPDLTPEIEEIPVASLLEPAPAVQLASIDFGPGGSSIPAAPAAEFPPPAEGPLRVGGPIERPEQLVRIEPTYPPLALRTHTEGHVILEAKIAKDGRVVDATVLRGLRAGCTEAALDAVRQWRYEPTLVGGHPVELYLTINVTFQLRNGRLSSRSTS